MYHLYTEYKSLRAQAMLNKAKLLYIDCGPHHTTNSKLHLGCSSTTSSAKLTACLRDLARHFKTEPTKTVAFCFGIPENNVSSRSQLILSQLTR
jgi:hypothetical protein